MADTQQAPKVGVNRGNAGKGRPKGSPNKITADLKRAILEAAEAAGGEGGTAGYLARQAEENPASFMTLLGKVLPLDHTNNGGAFTFPAEIVLRAARNGASDD